MAIYYAPMEGFTDAVYRRAHHICFGGVEKYYIPFISPTQNLRFTPRDKAAVFPEHNAGICAVPQILSNRADQFLWAARALADMGYREINLNVGCPSGTVTSKYKGSGMLRDLSTLKRFLDEVFAQAPAAISVKTRIGFTDPEEWMQILELYAQYPIYELTIHPRTRVQYYKGNVHPEAFAQAQQRLSVPLVYNGDVFSLQDAQTLLQRTPGVSLMLGRGLLTNPALAQEICGGRALNLADIRRFHDTLHAAYLEKYPRNITVARLCDAMKYLSLSFDDPHRLIKAMRKASSEEEYLQTVHRLFDEHPLREQPYYAPDLQ